MSSAPRHCQSRRRTLVQSGLSGIIGGIAVGAIVTLGGVVIPATSAQASVSSAVTVSVADQDKSGTAPLPDLKVTVSQTKDLQAQGIKVSWTGGKLSSPPGGGSGGGDYLQVMQCWGNDPLDASQPDRTTCQYGSFGTTGAARYTNIQPGDVAAAEDKLYTVPAGDFTSGMTSVPFKPYPGDDATKTVALVQDSKFVPNATDPANNQYFTKLTTNEVSWAGSGPNGDGSIKFEMQTATQASGLGCGTPVTTGGVVSGTPCWLVILPRGQNDPGSTVVGTKQSGLDFNVWKHKLAVKLDFQPVGLRCTLGSAVRQLAGSQLIEGAVRSWQPQLCTAAGGATYALIGQPETDAATAANSTDPQPLALTSSALQTDGTDSLTYAPVALSGVTIAFAIDRSVKSTCPGVSATDLAAYKSQNQLPFTELKLTPRLVAKLLSYSYYDSLPNGADKSEVGYTSPPNPGPNARNITWDKEFIEINGPEWGCQSIADAAIADMLEPLGHSDAASAVWKYVMSDKDAVDFLNGVPDPWGMKVNPWASTNPDLNPTGVGLALPTDSFPKPSPIERAATASEPALNLVTWRPYTNSLDAGGLAVLRGDGQDYGSYDPGPPPKYSKAARNLPGLQKVLGITSSASAAKYQLFTAALRNPAGNYVTATTDSLTAAAAAMTTDPKQAQVVGFDPASDSAKAAQTAYPLTMPVYAAVNAGMKDPTATDPTSIRKDYAAFIRYAVGAGQVSGTALGQLPDGYAPIPDAWKTQALAAATTIGGALPTTATPTPSPSATSAAQTTTKPVQSSSAGTSSSQVAPVAAQPVSTPTDPAPTGAAAKPLLGDPTPADPTSGALPAALPASIIAGLGFALAVPFVSRIRRRR
ncbi:hypothetical protein KPL76_11275 [Subtercola sp. PAMC28395]|uniref:hypothetical protein n=1 Tax=Subtercola sp. PAMC28395 TaxID=2846775 RepID=UPI001C0B0FE1|nr:hypothetical protein [Subtercola sp. PAMC28395]QWT23309.1 hypothetical protein KPL76_11275 [Subtercola sp. PAMC28395]